MTTGKRGPVEPSLSPRSAPRTPDPLMLLSRVHCAEPDVAPVARCENADLQLHASVNRSSHADDRRTQNWSQWADRFRFSDRDSTVHTYPGAGLTDRGPR